MILKGFVDSKVNLYLKYDLKGREWNNVLLNSIFQRSISYIIKG